MEQAMIEIAEIQAVVEAVELQIQGVGMNELQLAYVGGGCGDISTF